MTVSNFDRLQAFIAEADTAQGLAVTYGAYDQTKRSWTCKPATASDPVAGVCMEHAIAGRTCGVMTEQGSLVPVLTGGALAVGAKVTCDANGKAVTATGAYFGICMEAASAADVFVTIQYVGPMAA